MKMVERTVHSPTRIESDEMQRTILCDGAFARRDENRVLEKSALLDVLVNLLERLPDDSAGTNGQVSRLTRPLLPFGQPHGISRRFHEHTGHLGFQALHGRHMRQRTGIARARWSNAKSINDNQT